MRILPTEMGRVILGLVVCFGLNSLAQVQNVPKSRRATREAFEQEFEAKRAEIQFEDEAILDLEYQLTHAQSLNNATYLVGIPLKYLGALVAIVGGLEMGASLIPHPNSYFFKGTMMAVLGVGSFLGSNFVMTLTDQEVAELEEKLNYARERIARKKAHLLSAEQYLPSAQ
jgi:hypothetical protein